MPFLQSSGAISIANLNSFFPGSGTAMSNFYRGGGRVPATKTVTTTTREPTSGERYDISGGPFTSYWYTNSVEGRWAVWNNATVATPASDDTTSVTVGNVTYFRGTLRAYDAPPYGATIAYYAIYRTVTSTSTVNINTGIPSSGQISLSQFYGAETP